MNRFALPAGPRPAALTGAGLKAHKNARTAEEVFHRGLGGDEPAACPDQN